VLSLGFGHIVLNLRKIESNLLVHDVVTSLWSSNLMFTQLLLKIEVVSTAVLNSACPNLLHKIERYAVNVSLALFIVDIDVSDCDFVWGVYILFKKSTNSGLALATGEA